MTIALPSFVTQAIDPYVDEARSTAAQFHGDAMSQAGIITAKLSDIERAVRDTSWAPGEVKLNEQFQDLSQVWTDATVRVPMGTEWVLETWNALMLSGTATVILRVNGLFRISSTVTTAGLGTTGAFLARGTHLTGGDEFSFETIGMVATEVMQVYVQFKSRPIVSRRATNAGQPNVMADRPNDADDTLDRHSTPTIFQGENIRGENSRPTNVPAPLPFIRR